MTRTWATAAIVGLSLALSGVAIGQDIPEKKPVSKPPVTKHQPTEPKPTPKPPASTPPPVESTQPPIPTGPSAEELCRQVGGEWTGSACDSTKAKRELARATCLQAGGEWSDNDSSCKAKPSCQEGQKWNGRACVDDCKPGERRVAGKGCVAPPASAQTPRPAPPPPPLPPQTQTGGWGTWNTIAVIGGGLLLGTGLLTGGLAMSKKSSFTEQCSGKSCPESARSDWESAGTLADISTGTLIGGAVLLGLGLLLIPGPDKSPEKASAIPNLRVGAGSAQAGWRF